MSITIPDSVTTIGDHAFYGCGSLTSITIGNSVTSIGFYAFCNCSSLTSITIPDSVTSIGEWAFADCSSLTSITIPNSVTSIGRNAFYDCSSLTSITIPDSVTSIGDYAFSNCSSLTSITIPDSVTSIGSYTFAYCSGVRSITIPNSVKSIKDHAFYNCRYLVEIINQSSLNITKGNSTYGYIGWNAVTIHNGESRIINTNGYLFITSDDNQNYLLGYTGSSTDLVLPDNYNGQDYVIYYDAFKNSGLTSIVIPDSVTRIEWGAFLDCRDLINVYYKGSANEWTKISIGGDNSSLTAATLYYYSANEPVDDGNYWHYAPDGITPVIWVKEN